ncbi:hypothetical protein IAR55_005049 [Kwoniella newhampshirensis]|uniref:Homeobox domain-containing protein n=1 Tax=Kwoniella newhampshirensis TaxID=1651941 RepID=A0AAW0YX94_9TREE
MEIDAPPLVQSTPGGAKRDVLLSPSQSPIPEIKPKASFQVVSEAAPGETKKEPYDTADKGEPPYSAIPQSLPLIYQSPPREGSGDADLASSSGPASPLFHPLSPPHHRRGLSSDTRMSADQTIPGDEHTWPPAHPAAIPISCRSLQPLGRYVPQSPYRALHHDAPTSRGKIEQRPRLYIHPYVSPATRDDPRFHPTGVYSAGGMRRPISPRDGLPERRGRSFSPLRSGMSSPSFKPPRKRADDLQLSVLHEVFERTAYPSTEERDELARKLGMTSRSVQIWFQNRRRAVKVDRQSAVQRAEAELRARLMSEDDEIQRVIDDDDGRPPEED